jgi:hypothetical protein
MKRRIALLALLILLPTQSYAQQYKFQGPVSLSGTSCSTALNVQGFASAKIEADVTGTFAFDIVGSLGGTTYTIIPTTDASSTSGTPATTQNADGKYSLDLSGYKYISFCGVSGAGSASVYLGTIPAGGGSGGSFSGSIGNVGVTSISAGDNNIGNVDIVTVPTDPFGANADAASATGSISAKLRFIAATGIPITGTAAVSNAGTFAVQSDITKVNGSTFSATNPLFIRAVNSTGVIADDPAEGSAAGSNAPIPIGCDVEDALSGMTLLADGNRSKCRTDKDAVLYTRPYGSLAELVNPTVVSNTDGTATALVAAAGSGVKTYLTSVVCVNTSAGAVLVEIKDGSTTKWPLYLPAGGSNGAVFQSPLTGTANTAWNFDAASATTTIYCGATGFKSKI